MKDREDDLEELLKAATRRGSTRRGRGGREDDLEELLKAVEDIEMDFGVADLHVGVVELSARKVARIILCAREIRDCKLRNNLRGARP